MPSTTQPCRASRRALMGLIAAAGVVAALPAVTQAQAQNYPDRPITLVVPFTPGGQYDTHGRLLAKHMSTLLNQQVIVENRPGAGTTIGAEYVARAKPDGYTLLMAGAAFTTVPHTFASLRYKIEDFQTVSLVQLLPVALMINPKVLPVKDFKEFVAYAKANPGKVNYATTGPGVTTHLLGELIKVQLGIDIIPVHYKGSGPAMIDLLGGRVQSMFDNAQSHAAMIEAGKEVAIGITTEKRLPSAPNIPTFAEMGYPALSMSSWAGIFVPKGTPAAIVEKLHRTVVDVVNNDEVKNRMIADSTIPMSSSPQELDARIKRDYDTWGNVIRKIGGIRIE